MQLRFISSELNASEIPAFFTPRQPFSKGWNVLTVSGVADDPFCRVLCYIISSLCVVGP